MAVDNVYKHNSRSFYDVYNALIAAYPRRPTWLFKENAGLFDFMSELINRVATDIMYPVTREAAYAFANRCDYSPVEADGATDELTITLNTAKSKVLSTGYQVGGISTTTGKTVHFELTEDGDSGGTDTITVAVKQKRTYTNINVATIDNSDDYANYPIDGYLNIISDSISLTIDSLSWTLVDNFDDSESTDRHFMLIYQSSGRVRFMFGDGTYGKKPAVGSIVYATFSVTEGLSGRMDAGEITINLGGDSDIQTITNSGSSGGNDSELVESILRNAAANVRYRDIVWSEEDLASSALASSSSVVKAKGFPSVGTAAIHIIPSGGGSPSAPLKATVDTYVTARTQFGVMPVTVSDPSYVTTNITATFTTRTDFVEATVTKLLKFAMYLASSCIDSQIIDNYKQNGIDTCREDVINVLYPALAFTSSENEALEFIVEKWIYLLGDRDYREWGQELEVGDLWIMGNSLIEYGVDEFNLSAPTVNTEVDADEIHDSGTVTITPS